MTLLNDLPPFEENRYYNDNKELYLALKYIVEHYHFSYCRKLNAKSRIVQLEQELGIEFLQYKMLDWINASLPLLKDSFYTFSTKVTWILRGIVEFPKCATCNKDDKMKCINVNPFGSYPEHCCLRCACNDPITIAKGKATRLDRYGDENYQNVEKQQATTKKHAKEDPDFWKKRDAKSKKTCLKTYGVENPMQSEEVKNTLKARNLKKFGKEWFTQTDEFLETTKASNQQKYGKDWFTQTDEFKESAKETWMKNLGVDCPSKSHAVIAKIVQKYFYDGKYFSSAPEIALYIWLRDNNIPFIYQPKCDITYVHEGKVHKYFPDFEIEGKLVELKGDQFLKEDGTWQNPFDHSQDSLYEAKHQCCIMNGVTVLFHKDYKKYVDYVKEKYGKDFLHSLKASAE